MQKSKLLQKNKQNNLIDRLFQALDCMITRLIFWRVARIKAIKKSRPLDAILWIVERLFFFGIFTGQSREDFIYSLA